MHEPFTDENGNGLFDETETFADLGLDGVAGTGDDGEGNGLFDLNPRIQNWLDLSPAERVRRGEIDLISRYRGGLYLESGAEDYWDFMSHANAVMEAADGHYAEAPEPDPGYCLDFGTGSYESFIGDFPYPTEPIWFREKSVRLFWPPEGPPEDGHLGTEDVRVARWAHALSFCPRARERPVRRRSEGLAGLL